MSESKPKPPSPAKPAPGAKKPALEIKPQKDLEPDEAQSENVRGGQAAGMGAGRGGLFSDAALKSWIEPILDALPKLRGLRF